MARMQMCAKIRAGENKPFLAAAAGKAGQPPKQREQSYNEVPALTKL